MEDRTAANPVDSNSVHEISLSSSLPRAHCASKEAEGVRLYGRVSQPADIDTNSARLSHWQHCYGALWELKVAFEEQHNGGVGSMI